MSVLIEHNSSPRRSLQQAAALDAEFRTHEKGVGAHVGKFHTLRTETKESFERETIESEEGLARSIVVGILSGEITQRWDTEKAERRGWRLAQATLSLMLLKCDNR